MEKTKLNLATTDQGKTVAILSYLTIIGLVVSYVMNNSNPSSLGRFHIRQSIGMTITAIVSGVVAYIPGVGGILSSILGIVVLIAFIIALISAINGKEKELPIVGAYYQKWLSSI